MQNQADALCLAALRNFLSLYSSSPLVSYRLYRNYCGRTCRDSQEVFTHFYSTRGLMRARKQMWICRMDANIYQNSSIWRPRVPLVIAISYAMDVRSTQFRHSWRPKHSINQRFPKKKAQNPLQTAFLGRQNPQNPLRRASTAQHSKGRVLTLGRQEAPL